MERIGITLPLLLLQLVHTVLLAAIILVPIALLARRARRRSWAILEARLAPMEATLASIEAHLATLVEQGRHGSDGTSQ